MHPNAEAKTRELMNAGYRVTDVLERPFATVLWYHGDQGLMAVEVPGGWKGDREPKRHPRKPKRVIT